MIQPEAPDGFVHLPAWLDEPAQHHLMAEVLAAVGDTFWFQPTTPRWNRPFSVRMSNLGQLGWVSDAKGYRYQKHHPVTGLPWPAMPHLLVEIWQQVSGHRSAPQACLVNFYQGNARMGLHQDRDEQDLTAPVVSISLGDEALFRLGGSSRGDPTSSIRLRTGDICVLGGKAKLAFHGVDRIVAGSSALVPGGGRINLTIRRVD